MNVFYTSPCPVISANNLCKVHLRSQYKESTQMLSTVLRLQGVEDDRLCKLVQPNHPCTKWLRKSIENYNWLIEHALAMKALLNKPSKSDERMEAILAHTPNLPSTGFTEPPKVINTDEWPQLKQTVVFDTTTVAYQKYLRVKYHNWVTRTDKRKMKVEWVSGEPEYMRGDV